MNYSSLYRSIGISLFDAWRIFYIAFLISFFCLIPFIPSSGIRFLYSFLMASFIMSIISLASYSVIERIGFDLTLRDVRKKIYLIEIDSIETWWEYGVEESTIEYTPGNVNGKMRGHKSSIFVFASIKAKNGSAVIFHEVSSISNKFPNSHPYNIEKNVDQSKLVKVWNIDLCIEKLRLTSLLKK